MQSTIEYGRPDYIKEGMLLGCRICPLTMQSNITSKLPSPMSDPKEMSTFVSLLIVKLPVMMIEVLTNPMSNFN